MKRGKKLKWILTTVIVLVVAVVVAGYAVLANLDLNELKVLAQREVKSATGRDLTIAGPIDLQVSFKPTISLEQVSFSNASWGSQPELATIKRFEVSLDLIPLLSGTIKIDHLTLIEPSILLEINEKGVPNWQFDEAKAQDVPTADSVDDGGPVVVPEIDQMEIRNGRLTFKNAQSGETHAVQLNDLEAELKSGERPLHLNVDAVFNEVPLTLTGQFTRMADIGDGPFSFGAQLNVADTALSADGQITDLIGAKGLTAKITAKGESLASLSKLAGSPLPPIGPYEVSANVTLDEAGTTAAVTDLVAKLGTSDLSGSLSANLANQPPMIDGNLTSQLIDLAALSEQLGGDAEAAPANAGPYVFTEDPLPFDALQSADAKLSLAIQTLRLQPGLELQATKLTAVLEKGRLSLDPLTAQLSGGTITLKTTVDGGAKTPSLDLSASAADIDYGALLKSMAIDDGVQGTLGVAITLKGAGGSARQIVSGLNGRSEVVGGKGLIDKGFAGIMATGLGEILNPFSEGSKGIPLNCLVSRFDIENGLATSRAMLVDTKSLILLGSGNLDLKTEKLDFKFDTQSKDVSLASLAVPFKVTGTLANPTAGPDPIGTATSALKVVGTVFMPIEAVGSILTSAVVGESTENRCVKALADAEAQAKAGGEKSTIEEVGETIEGVGEGIGEGLKNLFGD